MTKTELEKEVKRLQREINHCDAVHQELTNLKNSNVAAMETLSVLYDQTFNIGTAHNDHKMIQISKTLDMALSIMRTLVED